MGHRQKFKKRPCRICRKWFSPDNRLGDRQKTCGAEECKRKWHTKKCAAWNKKNRSYFQAIYLSSTLQSTKSLPPPADQDMPSSNLEKIYLPTLPSTRFAPKLPRDVIQEVIGAQPLIIIEYVAQQILNSVKEVIRLQPIDIQCEINRLPSCGDLRGDRPGRVP
jgi:hypothetical protein